MSMKINDDSMSLEIDGHVIATAELRDHAVADGQGAWAVSSYAVVTAIISYQHAYELVRSHGEVG